MSVSGELHPNQQQSTDNKLWSMLGQGRGRYTLAQILILISCKLLLCGRSSA